MAEVQVRMPADGDRLVKSRRLLHLHEVERAVELPFQGPHAADPEDLEFRKKGAVGRGNPGGEGGAIGPDGSKRFDGQLTSRRRSTRWARWGEIFLLLASTAHVQFPLYSTCLLTGIIGSEQATLKERNKGRRNKQTEGGVAQAGRRFLVVHAEPFAQLLVTKDWSVRRPSRDRRSATQ